MRRMAKSCIFANLKFYENFMNFITEHSLWFLPLCLLLGLGYAFILYRKVPSSDLSVRIKRIAFAVRTTVVFLIAFLLLNPIVATMVKQVEKPVIVLGLDNSQSLAAIARADYYQNDFLKQTEQLREKLQKDFTVETYLIGDSLRRGEKVDYDDETTHLSAFFEHIHSVYATQNLGAVVLMSDGIFNAGKDPYYVANQIKSPVYTVLMGDTVVHKDLLVGKVNFNKVVYRNSVFPIEIQIRADKLSGETTTLQIFRKDELIYQKQINLNANNYLQWEKLNFEAKESGLQRYRIVLSKVNGEITTVNNEKDIFFEVIDRRKKVALIYHAPHPDIAAIRQVLVKTDMYQVESFDVTKWNAPLSDYDIVVLHQLPSNNSAATALLDQMDKMDMPCFYILGQQSNYAWFNRLGTGLQIQIGNNLQNDAFPLYNANYTYFTLSEGFKQLLPQLPPLKVPFGQYKLSPSALPILFQKIGGVSTSYPLLSCHQDGETRSVVLVGDGLWRWRNYNYMLTNGHDEFEELVTKIFQYLSLKTDKSLFRVTAKNVFSENENIRFDAQLFNQNYEIVNTPEVSMTITCKETRYAFTFNRTFNAYSLDIGSLPQGDYAWTASAVFNDVKHSQSGHFSVDRLNLESLNLTANHQLLLNLAALQGGKSFADTDFEGLYQTLVQNTDIKPVVHYQKRHASLLDNLILFACILTLLAAEWVLRKWSGMY
jgi:hypothetical protein